MKWILLVLAAGAAGTTAAWCVAALARKISELGRRSAGGLSRVSLKLPAAGLSETVAHLKRDHAGRRGARIRAMAGTIAFLAALLFAPFILAALLGIGVYCGIGWYFGRLKQREREIFDDQLVEALGAISSGVRAGRSLAQALEGAAAQSGPPLAHALHAMLDRVRLGMPLSRALQEMSSSVRSRELEMAVTAMNLAAETGGALGEVLLQLSATMRERKKIRGKVMAMTAQARASGMVMSLVPVFLLLVLYAMEPDIFGLLFTTIAGNAMLVLVFAMIACGAWFINKIVSIDL